MESYFTAGIPHLSSQMPPVYLRQLQPGQMAQPQIQGQSRALGVLRELPGNLHICFLKNIRIIDTPLKPAIEAKVHHPFESIAMTTEKLLKRALLALDGSPQQG
jgi:hypothetical protein